MIFKKYSIISLMSRIRLKYMLLKLPYLPIISRSVSKRKTIGFPLSTSTSGVLKHWLAGKSKKTPNSMEVFIAAKMLTSTSVFCIPQARSPHLISPGISRRCCCKRRVKPGTVGDFRDFPSHVWGHRRRVDEDAEKKMKNPWFPVGELPLPC